LGVVDPDVSKRRNASKGQEVHSTFKTPGTTNLKTRLRIPEHLNPQTHHCEDHKISKSYGCKGHISYPRP